MRRKNESKKVRKKGKKRDRQILRKLVSGENLNAALLFCEENNLRQITGLVYFRQVLDSDKTKV